jgi:outer membrane protein assembly factor BamA
MAIPSVPGGTTSRLIAGGTALLILLVLASSLARPWIAGYALQRAADALREFCDCELRASRADFALTSLAFTLDDVTIVLRSAPEQSLVVADRLSVDLGAAALGGGLVFDRIELVNPKLSWTQDPRYDRDRGRAPPSPAPITVGRLDVVGLDADITTSASVRLIVRGLAASMSGTGPNRLAGAIRVERGVRLEMEGGAASLDEVISELAIEDDTLIVRSLIARSQSTEIRLDGRLAFAEAGGYDLRYSGRLDLGALHTSPAVTGRVALTGIISGALSSPTATVDVTAEDLDWSAIAKGRFTGAGRIAASALLLDTFSLRADGIEATGRGRLSLADGMAQSHVIAEWRSPGLRAFAALVDIAPTTLPILPASGSIDLRWDGAVPALATLAGALSIDVREAGSGHLAVKGDTGRWALEYQHTLADSARAAVRLESTLDTDDLLRSRLTGSFEITSEHVVGVIGALRGASIPLSPAFDAVTSGAATVRGLVSGSIREPSATATVTAAGLSVGGLDGVHAEATLTLDRRQIGFAPLVVEGPAGRLELRGAAAMGGGHGAGDFDLRLDRPAVFTPMLPGEWQPTGRLAAKGTWTASAGGPHVLAHLAGHDLGSNGVEFQSVDGDLELTGNVIEVRNLQLTQPGGHGRVDGTYNLSSTDLAMNVVGQGLRIAINRLPIGGEQPDEPAAALQSVDIAAHVTGPVRRPSGRFSLSAEEVRVNGRNVGPVIARAHDESGRAQVDLEAPRFAATAAASVSLARPWDYAAAVVFTDTGLVPLAELGGAGGAFIADYSGHVSATVEAHGNLEHVSLATVTMDIAKLEGEARGRPFALDGSARVSYDGARVVIDPFHVSVGSLSARGGGSWSMSPDAGTDVVAMSLAGRLDDVTAFLPPGVRDDWSPQGPISARLELRNLSGAATLSGEVLAELTSLQPTQSPTLNESSPLNVSGAARMAVDVHATALATNALAGTVVIESGALSAREVSVEQRVPTRLRIKDGWVEIEQFEWTLPEGTLNASGRIALDPRNETSLRLFGASSLSLADALVAGRGDGRARFDVSIQHAPAGWTYGGVVELDHASLLVPAGRLSLAGWSGRLAVSEGTVAAALRGQANGGDVAVDGTISRSASNRPKPLTVTAKNVLFEVPRGFKSELDADLTWSSDEGRHHLSGNATITAYPYRESAAAMLRTVAALTGASRNTRQALPEWLGKTTIAIGLQANGPLMVENSVANLAMVPRLQLVGTVADAAFNGSMDIVDDGRLRVGGRSYRLRESAIEFAPERGLMPRLNVSGETRIGSYDVTIRVSGPADAIETSLSSNPPLGEHDLQSLLVTGQTAGLTGDASNADAFAVGAVSGGVLGLAGEFVGLDSVRVGSSDELELVSSDVEPSTRLTVSKRLGQRFEVLVSENLDDSELTWVFIYRPRPSYAIGLFSRDGVETTLAFRHEVAFGPGYSARPITAAERRVADVITQISISGEPGFAESELRRALDLDEGDDFDLRRWADDRARLQRFYCERLYCAVRVMPTRAVTQAAPDRREVALAYRIIRGPRTELQVVGYPPSQVLLERLKGAWADVLVPQLLAEELRRVATGYLIDEGYLRARVEVTLDSSRPGTARAVVAVVTGARTNTRQIAFAGNEAIDTAALQQLVTTLDPAGGVWQDPKTLLQEIAADYRSRGYFAAMLSVDDVVVDGDRALLTIRIVEGPLAHVTTLRLDGVAAEHSAEIHKVIGLARGSTFAEGAERAARARLERHYRDIGYRSARVDVDSRVTAGEGRVDLTFTVSEGTSSVVRAVAIEGVQTTNDGLVAGAITVKAGRAAAQSDANETQRRLYRLGTFRSAEVRFDPGPAMPAGERLVDAVVAVQEPKRYLLRYGIALSDEYEPAIDTTERSVGLSADLRDRNFLGRAIALGLGVRLERTMSSLRGLFAVPRLGSLPVRTNVSLIARKEDLQNDSGVAFSDDEFKLVVEQRWQLRPWVELAWGYSSAGRRLVFDLVEPVARAVTVDGLLASLNTTVVMDRRNSVFDASRGWFHSTNVQWGLRGLGSDFDYVRVLVRGSYYRPIGPFVLASNARWGELTRLGGVPPLTVVDLYFNAGGTQTVRGYKQDELSGAEVLGIPVGGTRLVVFNQELRMPIVGIVKGVLFADAGNTFVDRTNASIWNLPVGVGVGVRIKTPLAPIRIDVGYPLSGGSAARLRWHFSIGQMF